MEIPRVYVELVLREKRGDYISTKAGGAGDIFDLFSPFYKNQSEEKLVVAYLDNKHQVNAWQVIAHGSVSGALVHPREVMKGVCLYNAAAFIMMHNHPSGDTAPSREDLEITRRIREVSEVMGVRFLDHVIFGRDENNNPTYCSFVDSGYW